MVTVVGMGAVGMEAGMAVGTGDGMAVRGYTSIRHPSMSIPHTFIPATATILTTAILTTEET